MIYQQLESDAPLSQGDIVDNCPILVWDAYTSPESETRAEAAELDVRVVVLTQACDLAQTKATRVVVALVHSAQDLVQQGVLTPSLIRDQIRTHRVYGWYFLPTGVAIPESIVDLRDLHTVPRIMLDDLVREGQRLCRIASPFREHLAQHFSITYARIGLPQPYETQPE